MSKLFVWDQLSLSEIARTTQDFITYKAKYSLVDCQIAHYCHRARLPVASFDKHFKELNLAYWNPSL